MQPTVRGSEVKTNTTSKKTVRLSADRTLQGLRGDSL